MRQRVLREAIAELSEAVRYYEDRAPGVGRQFADEVRGAFKFTRRYPRARKRVAQGKRSAALGAVGNRLTLKRDGIG